jgi:transposase-like protein
MLTCVRCYLTYPLSYRLEQEFHRCSRLGFTSMEPAQRPWTGIEVMHMIKKRDMVMEGGTQGLERHQRIDVLPSRLPRRDL